MLMLKNLIDVFRRRELPTGTENIAETHGSNGIAIEAGVIITDLRIVIKHPDGTLAYIEGADVTLDQDVMFELRNQSGYLSLAEAR